MRLDRATILALDEEEFTPEEKLYLLAKFAPEQGPAPWQLKLRKDWNNAKRWRRLISDDLSAGASGPFRYNPAWILRAAHDSPPESRGADVTDFSGWIFSLYHEKKDPQSLANGRAVEEQVRRRYELLRQSVPEPVSGDWEPLYRGIGEQDRKQKPPMIVTALRVGGQSLRARPDYAFRETGSRRVLIVEIKASNRDIPSDGWPNLRAQLWCYSQIDDWVVAPEVLLTAEYWGFNAYGIFPRGAQVWRRGDGQFEAQNRELFRLYGNESQQSTIGR